MNPKKSFLPTFVLTLLICCSAPAAELAFDKFKKNAELCDHFAGEWDSDLPEKDKRNIERNVDKYCALAQRQRAFLMKKYSSNPETLKVLNQYESVTSYSK